MRTKTIQDIKPLTIQQLLNELIDKADTRQIVFATSLIAYLLILDPLENKGIDKQELGELVARLDKSFYKKLNGER